jgi:hypothetical protein
LNEFVPKLSSKGSVNGLEVFILGGGGLGGGAMLAFGGLPASSQANGNMFSLSSEEEAFSWG